MEKNFDYSPPKEISDSTFISLFGISKIIDDYCGRVRCIEHSEVGGKFNLEWKAYYDKNELIILPTKREGIELEGILKPDQFTHSPIFDKALREYIRTQINEFEE